jgi:uncharacterized membrane protein YphA (DoxX/SURF4 family)
LKQTERHTVLPMVDLMLRWALGFTFALAGSYKLWAPETFVQIIAGYDLLPAVAIQPAAVLLPCLELVVGGALISGVYPRAAALLVNGLLVIFMGAVAINLLRGQTFDCGCFPTVMRRIYASSPVGMLVRDALLLLAATGVMVYRGPRKWAQRQLAGRSKRRPPR